MKVQIPFRSAPAQNARPSPVTIPTNREGSASSQLHIEASSRWPALLMQLRDLGRHRVTRRVWGVGKLRRVKVVDGGLIWKLEEILEGILLFL